MRAETRLGTEVSVAFMKDVEPNLGGWYCTISLYDDDGEICESDFDDFCIHPEDCPNEGCMDANGEVTVEAEEFARHYVGTELFY